MENKHEENPNKRFNKLLIIYFITFYLCWTIKEITFSAMEQNVTISILSGTIKILIWVLPVLIILKYFEKESIIDYLRLKISKESWRAFFYILLIVSIAITLKMMILDRSIMALSFNTWLNTVILAGITEEIVFRGFIFNRFNSSKSFWRANIISSILFVVIHFPIWYVKDISVVQWPLFCINTFIIGVILGYIYKKSDILWIPIIFHSGYNLYVVL